MKKLISFTMIFALSFTLCGFSYDAEDLTQAASRHIADTVPNPSVSSIGGEWAVIALARSGTDVPTSIYENYLKNLKEYVKKCGGVLHKKKSTEYSRVILALTAIGENPEDVDGYNLMTPLGDYEETVWQGVNGAVWALIALDSGGYEVPVNTAAKVRATREMYVSGILAAQASDGGWTLMDNGASEADITAMAITALAPYQESDEVSAAIERGLTYLSEVQTENGGFFSQGEENCESAAQVLTALCTLGISVDDSRFIKNGRTVLDSLISYHDGSGGFYHSISHSGNSQMSSEQALYALAALKRFKEGKTAIFDMSDAVSVVSTSTEVEYGLPGKNPLVKQLPVGSPKSFSDIQGNAAQSAIEQLAARGIINGKSENEFDPDGTITRAEFAAIITRGLGLEQRSEKIFADVSENDWHFGYVAAAYSAGIINGVSAEEFNPDGLITREEAAVMLRRAAALCGMHDTYDGDSVRNILAAFTDYIKASDWAREALAFCFDKGISDDSAMEILPKASAKRSEVALMLFNMLTSARLI